MPEENKVGEVSPAWTLLNRMFKENPAVPDGKMLIVKQSMEDLMVSLDKPKPQLFWTDSYVLANIATKHHAWIEAMGWHNKTPLESLALVASEVGEAVNECRGLEPTNKLGEELADIILRALDMSVDLGIDITKEINAKMKINHERGNYKNRAC